MDLTDKYGFIKGELDDVGTADGVRLKIISHDGITKTKWMSFNHEQADHIRRCIIMASNVDDFTRLAAELEESARLARLARDGDSNDEEIQALWEALEAATALLGMADLTLE